MKFDKKIDIFNEDILNEVCRLMGIEPTNEKQQYFIEDTMNFKTINYFDDNLNYEESEILFHNNYEPIYTSVIKDSKGVEFGSDICHLRSAA